jgi:hypothetical protein
VKHTFLAFSLVTLLACSSKQNTGPEPTGNAAIDEACAADAESWCGPLERCSPFTMKQLYGDKASCVTREKLWCTAFLQSKDSETPDQLKACAAAYLAQSCDEFYGAKQPDVCKLAPGPRADGATCQYGSQCQSSHCKIPRGSNCGVCSQKVPEGGQCGHTSDCIDGYCRISAMMCTGALPVLDQPCTGICSFNSGVNLTCALQADGSGVCKQAIQAGGACDPMADACDQSWNGLLCDPSTLTCKQTATVAGTGEACETATYCAASGLCTPVGADGGSICVAPPGEGQACDPVNSLCDWPAVCVNSKCVMPVANQCQ